MDQEWYRNFVDEKNMDRELLFSVFAASNYMGIKPLMDLIILKITFMITGKGSSAEVSRCEPCLAWTKLCFLF